MIQGTSGGVEVEGGGVPEGFLKNNGLKRKAIWGRAKFYTTEQVVGIKDLGGVAFCRDDGR